MVPAVTMIHRAHMMKSDISWMWKDSMRGLFKQFTLLFALGIPFICTVLIFSHYYGRYEPLSPTEARKAADAILETDNRHHTTLSSDVTTDLSAYIRAKFENSCYPEDAFTRWWKSYELPDKHRVPNEDGCRQTLSDVFIVGVKKCATDAVRNLLVVHPSVMFRRSPSTNLQEIHFYDRHYNDGYGWYRKQLPFVKKGQLVLEKTPQTFSFPEDAPRKIATEANPKTKIIVILCDPVVRAISDYVHERKVKAYQRFRPPYYRIDNKSFEKSVFNESGMIDFDNELIKMGMYSKHMKRWLEYFPKTQIYVIDGNDFKVDPVSEIQKIEKFLGLPSYLQKEHLDFNSDTKFYCIVFPKIRCPNKTKGRRHPQIPTEVTDQLYAFYQPYDNELQNLLNRKFSWMR
uniref:Heparan sulfate glucosamine 3-O-sulfotransferase 2-like n=1 Tax=Saccoglossus kowalevskii TaxID=10224 RepID=A0ABM0MLL4_SACKO|nr:PREDICTED: heparan sulfate glucosamine 3-O-sulfotransferase 2-like [Saccoglossus kowalevskii]